MTREEDIKFINEIIEKLTIHKNNPDVTQLDYAVKMLEDWKHELCSEKPLRTPTAEGVLPLTEEELSEFGNILRIGDVLGVRIKGCTLENKRYPDYWQEFPNNYKAILWLAKRFNLEV